MIKDLPNEILHTIYMYAGSNTFILNRHFFLYINGLRGQFIKRPIVFYYKLILLKRFLLRDPNTGVLTIGRGTNIHVMSLVAPSIYALRTKNIPIGFIKNRKFHPNEEIKKRAIPKEHYITNKNKNGMYIGDIYIGEEVRLFRMWTLDTRINLYTNIYI